MRMCNCGKLDLERYDSALGRARGVIDQLGHGHSPAVCHPDVRAPFLDHSIPGVTVVRMSTEDA